MCAILKASILDELAFICSDDFQTTCVNGLHRHRAGQEIDTYRERVRILSDTLEDREDVILAVAAKASKLKYAEARLHRALMLDDVEKLDVSGVEIWNLPPQLEKFKTS